jgi:hypothetical protein
MKKRAFSHAWLCLCAIAAAAGGCLPDAIRRDAWRVELLKALPRFVACVHAPAASGSGSALIRAVANQTRT